MFDLAKKRLPNAISLDGEYVQINTDYRIWLKFWRQLKSLTANETFPLDFIFAANVPPLTPQLVEECMAFFTNSNPLPRPIGTDSTAIPYDYDVDSDYIYAAFMQQYGIDLLDTDMHWHKFKALFDGITEPCKLANIILHRCYSGTGKDYIKLKMAWEITPIRKKDAYYDELELALLNGGDVAQLLDTRR